MIIDSKTFFGAWSLKNIDASIETIIAKLKQYNIDRAVMCSLKGIMYDYKEGNAETIAMAEKHPEIIPAATINPSKYTGGNEIAALKKAGCKLLRLASEHQGWPIDFLPTRIIFEEAEKRQMPISINANLAGDITKIYNIVEDRKLRVIIHHIHYTMFSEAILAGKRCPQIYFDVQRMNGPHTIDIFVKELGADRLVYGSNAPFDNIPSSLMLAQNANISDDDKEKILSKNITRLLDL